MEILRKSYIYALYCAIIAWCSRQFRNSLAVKWFTGQPVGQNTSAITAPVFDTLRTIYASVFEKLKLGRLLRGSIFLHPLLFAAAAMILAPLVPTMVVLALVGGCFFSLLLKMGVDRDTRLTPSPLNGYIVLYALIYFYSTLTSTSFAGSLFPGLLTIAFVLFFFCVTSSELDNRRLEQLMWVLMAVGAVISLYGFYQFLFPERFVNVWTDTDMFSTIAFRVYSTLENPNVLGEYFLLVIPLGCAMVLTADSRSKLLLSLMGVGLMGICLILTYSRGCYLGLLFAAAVFLVLLDARFIFLGVIAVALCPLYLPESVLTRFTSIGDMSDSSTSYRVYIWMGTLAMLKNYWFCGLGPGTEAYNIVYPEYAYNAITAPHSHNLFLQITCDTGICGIAVFIILIVAFYRMMFTAIAKETDQSARIFQIAGTSAITGFLVQSMTDYTFYNYRVMLLFFCMLGLCVVFSRMGTPKKEAAQ